MTATLAEMIAKARDEVRESTPAQASDALNRGDLDLILDVRERDEYGERHLPQALNIPRGLLELRADPASPAHDPELSASPSARILVYCTRSPGARSLLAAQTLLRMGYERVEVLDGGLNGWAESGLPVETEHQPAGA